MKKRLGILMIILLIPAMLIGCSPKFDADKSAQIISNFIVKNDKSGLTQLGDTKSAVYQSIDTQKDGFKKGFKDEIKKTLGIELDDSTANKFYDAYTNALKKVKITTSVVSKSGETAKVSVKTTYIDYKKIIFSQITKLLDTSLDSNATSSSSYADSFDSDDFSEKYINNIISDLNSAKPSTKTKEKTFNFVIKNHVWVPQNPQAYANDIIDLASGGLQEEMNKLKMTPDQTAKMLFDFFIKGDKSGFSKVFQDFTGDDYSKKIVELQQKTFNAGIKSIFTNQGISVSDADCNKVYSAYRNALNNISLTAKTISKTDTTATVSIKTNYIDFTNIFKTASTEAVADVRAMNLTDVTQAKNEFAKAFLSHAEKDLNAAKPGTETKEQTFDFKLTGGIWLPEDSYGFGKNLNSMILGESY